jgi:serine/threonine protein kinase
VVVSAVDVDTNHKVAIKKIPRLFADLVDAKRILREIKLLRHFRHENVIGLRDLVPAYGDFEELFIVLDYMDTDLHKIIYSSNNLTDDHIQYFLYQILRGLKYIHSANVIHRDLKPSNLLLNANCHLKICDFGLARGFKEQDYMTEYVVTRWYRAPEIMCSCEAYDFKIDVWSTGCILAELLMRNPIFPGDDYKQQLNLIFNILGTPTEQDMAAITNEFAMQYIASLPTRPKVPLAKVIGRAVNPLAIDLLEKMLTFDPKKRLSVDEALAHPYLSSLHDPKIEVTCAQPWDHEFEHELMDKKLTKESLQEFMFDEIYHFRPDIKGRVGRGRRDKLEHAMNSLDINN